MVLVLSGCATTGDFQVIEKSNSYIDSYGVRVELPAIAITSPARISALNHYELTATGSTATDAAASAYNRAVKMLLPTIEELEDDSLISSEIHHLITLNSVRKTNNIFHALVLIKRDDAKVHLREMLDNLDEQTERTVSGFNATHDSMQKIALLETVIKRQQLRASFQHSLRKLDPEHKGRESPWDTRKWSLKLNKLFTALRINPSIKINQTDAPALEDILTGELRQGLITGGLKPTKALKADYLLNGQLYIEEDKSNQNYVKARGELQLELQKIDSDRAYGIKTWSLEATALDLKEAKLRLFHKAQQVLKQSQRDTIIGIALQHSQTP